MPQYELRFQIPERRLGEMEPYQAFSVTVQRCMEIKNRSVRGAKVAEVHVTGGSLFGSVMIEADSYESALSLICRETPIIQLDWHLEEEVSPDRTAQILQDALKQRIK